MRSLVARLAAVLATTLIVSTTASGNVEISAKPGGKVKVTHGAPMWRDDFEAELKKELNWRLGSNAATTLETEAGILFDDCVIFPGTYNLALTGSGSGDFQLVFHHDGTYYKGEKHEGKAALTASTVEGKQVTKALEIELPKGSDKKGYSFQITFGKHRIAHDFSTAKAKTIKAKAGKAALSVTYLERTDIDALTKKLDAAEVAIARVATKDGDPVTLFLRGGSAPGARLDGGSSLTATKEQAKAKAPGVLMTAAEGDKTAKITVQVGDSNYTFELPESSFETTKAPSRG